MNHIGTQELETKRLLLRRFVAEDAAAMFNNWAKDEKVTEFLRWPAHSCIEVTESVLSNWIKMYHENDYYQWAIVLKEIGEPVGTIGVVSKNEKLNNIHIGYCIGSRWWNQGITSEAFSAIITFMFDEVKANRIESQHDPNNLNSGRVMCKCGLEYEGTLRQADYNNKGIVDAMVYGLLASDFYSEK